MIERAKLTADSDDENNHEPTSVCRSSVFTFYHNFTRPVIGVSTIPHHVYRILKVPEHQQELPHVHRPTLHHNHNTISKTSTMVTPADLIRELTLTNKHLIKKNENLKFDNHNLRVTNDMLKDKAATDQAIMNAAITIKKLETYNQALEDKNQHLREQLEFCAERKKIDDELEVLRKDVKSIDEELEKRSEEAEILEELEEQMKRLKQMSILETVQEDVQEAFQEDTLGGTHKNVEQDFQHYPLSTKEDKE
jgi:DNA repair exonuclease SbcCD ATPase subunit